MREVTIKILQYDELTDTAKKVAREWWRAAELEIGYAWADESLKSLTKFAEHFGATLSDYSIDWLDNSPSSARFNYPDNLDAGALTNIIGQLKTDGSCQFTGYCADDDCNEGAVAAHKAGVTDLGEILQAGFKTWLKSCQADAQAALEDDNVAESIRANEYEFYESGKRAAIHDA